MSNQIDQLRNGDRVADERTRQQLREAADIIERLRAALAPFAKLAAGIPGNWPGECPLRIDRDMHRGSPRYYELIAYHGITDDGKPLGYEYTLLPTIAEWRAAEEALK